MRSNWLDLRACVGLFCGLAALGVWYGVSGGDDGITGGLFLCAFGVVVVGTVWNGYLFARGTAARRAERWDAEGRCWNCGYDLKGNRSGVCPECGTRVRE